MDDIVPKMKNILANTSLYKMLDSQQIARVAADTSPMRMSPNMCVVNQGDPAEGAFWVVYGQVKVGVYSKQGGEKTLAILGPGKCFGLGEMLLDQPHLAFVKTTADTLLLHTGRGTMLEVAQENFNFSREVMSCLGRQFYALMRDIETYSHSARQRLAGYLMRQAESTGCQDQIELVANKVLIASRLSLAPETLSRLFREFVAEGLITVTGRRIRILDWDGLTAMVK
jgi:CRP-like cAMP-binding protein